MKRRRWPTWPCTAKPKTTRHNHEQGPPPGPCSPASGFDCIGTGRWLASRLHRISITDRMSLAGAQQCCGGVQRRLTSTNGPGSRHLIRSARLPGGRPREIPGRWRGLLSHRRFRYPARTGITGNMRDILPCKGDSRRNNRCSDNSVRSNADQAAILIIPHAGLRELVPFAHLW